MINYNMEIYDVDPVSEAYKLGGVYITGRDGGIESTAAD